MSEKFEPILKKKSTHFVQDCKKTDEILKWVDMSGRSKWSTKSAKLFAIVRYSAMQSSSFDELRTAGLKKSLWKLSDIVLQRGGFE